MNRPDVSDEYVEDFKRLWKKEFKENISDELARERAADVLELYMMMAKHVSRKHGDRGLDA